MDFPDLETFIAIVEKGSVSAAAAYLGLSQPAVSKRVAKMEQEMGAPLFAKGHRHSALTPEGAIFYKGALRILDCGRKTRIQIAELSQDLCGSVSISASSIPGDYILPGLLAEFNHFHPSVEVKVTVSDSKTALEDLSDKAADLAIVGWDRSLPGFTSEVFLEDELVLAVPKSHPLGKRKTISIDELSHINLIGRNQGSGTRQVWEREYRAKTGLTKEISLQFGHALAVVNAVAQGAEGGVVSKFAAKDNPNVAFLTFDPPLNRAFYMVHGLFETRTVEALANHLMKRR